LCESIERSEMKTRHAKEPGQRGREGISLIECLAYIGLVVVITGAAYSMFDHLSDSSRTLNRAAADIVRALDAGERWRDDLHAASGSVRLSEIGGGGQRLTIPQTAGDIVYEYRDNTLWRQAGGETNLQLWLAGVKTSAMIADATERVKAWRWELELQTRTHAPGGPQLKPLFTFEAVAGPK